MTTHCLVTILLIACATATRRVAEKETQVLRELIREWAPLVWLAPGERFLPLGVPEFLGNVESDDEYLRTKIDVGSLLRNRSSFLYGRKPAGLVPVYALVRNCMERKVPKDSSATRNRRIFERRQATLSRNGLKAESINVASVMRTNDVTNSDPKTEPQDTFDSNEGHEAEEENRLRKLHFHVTYWMFYPFSEGKAVCVLDLGFFGSWPIPTVGGVCLGMLKEYGNHVGDWEHMSLYFKGDDYPLAMYVSAHDAGAFYRFDSRSGTFAYESQETRKGIFQKPIFPETVYTADGSHPVLFSARGSHGLWTAPGKHKFVRLPRLYDESGFGTAWPTWNQVELLSVENERELPGWMTFRGKWGNPRSNCHPLARFGFNICEFVDGPAGIPTKRSNFQC